jgi:hypothetical protein
MAKLWVWLKSFVKRLLLGKRARDWVEASAMPVLSADPAAVDWKCRDVLVGSLGSKVQLEENLKWKYYYVPACYLRQKDLPIRYVAIYQSRNLFDEESGICYYGEVTGTELMQRWEIRFPVNRNNKRELYYAFAIREWKQLENSIEIRDEWVSQPRLTNLFLLKNCRYTYELFNIDSEKSFRLAALLRKLLEVSEAPFSHKIGRNRIVTYENGKIQVLTADGRHRDSLSLEDLKECPSGCLLRLNRAL